MITSFPVTPKGGDLAERLLQVEIVVSAPGLRVFLSPEEYLGYQADPLAYVANKFHATPQQLRRYLGTRGVIQCMHIRSNRKQCKNQYVIQVQLGQTEFTEWLKLDASGWYCNRHSE